MIEGTILSVEKLSVYVDSGNQDKKIITVNKINLDDIDCIKYEY